MQLQRHRPLTIGFLLALVAIAACTPPTGLKVDPTTPKESTGGSVSVKRTPTPTPNGSVPTKAPTVEPTRMALPPTPAPTPTPTPAPPGTIFYRELVGDPSKDGKTHLHGKIFDDEGKALDRGPNITIKSALGEVPINVENGQYVIDELKVTGDCTITADQYGSTPRTQYVKVGKGRDYTLNFGEPETPTQVFALQNPPEITAVTPNQFSKDVDPTSISLTIQVSEALNGPNRDAFVASLRLLPLNAVSAAGKAQTDLTALSAADVLKPTDAKLDSFDYNIGFYRLIPDLKNAGAFLIEAYPWDPGFPTKAQPYGIDASERTFTVNFPLPLLNGQTPAQYQLVMVADSKHPVKDVVGNVLGTDTTGTLGTQPPDGQVINNVFLSPYIGPDSFKKDDAKSRWDSTHVNAISILYKPDTTPPAITKMGCAASVAVTVIEEKNGVKTNRELPNMTEIYMEFSEALEVPGPGRPISRDTVRKLENYTFAVGQNVEYLAASSLLSGGLKDKADPVIDLKSDTIGFGSDGKVLGKEFRIIPAKPEDVSIEILPYNAVRIRVLGNDKLFDKTNANAIMVRVAGIHDPADNILPNAQADKPDAQLRSLILRTQ